MKRLGLFILMTVLIIITIFAAIILLFLLGDFLFRDPVIASLPDYENKEFYTSGGIQDFTDYAKYTYDSVTVKRLESSKYFTVTTDADTEEILLHIDNFERWVEAVGGELKENYDFDKSIVTRGDFFYIKTKAGKPIGNGEYGKFDNYTVYYFDIDTQILYYFHNNI